MEIIEETRRARLRMLVNRHKSMANLCEALGYARTDNTVLTRILNANIRHDRGVPYTMGSPMARRIEQILNLPVGWMDTPLTKAELYGEDDPRVVVMRLIDSMPPEQVPIAARLLGALIQPSTATPSFIHQHQ